MVVQHNLSAMNTNRMLGITTSAQAKSTEKLSSGYRINRAADDAAGLTISEKMRKQIRGLDKASSNAQDGVSAVQTAEGALTEVHSMLQRMNELATQASNGTNSQVDRDAIQAEVDQLGTEIDRLSETTKFNEIYLLKGDKAGTSSDVKVAAHDAGFAGTLTDNGSTATFKLDNTLEDGSTISIAGQDYTIGAGSDGKTVDSYKQTTDATLLATTVKTGDSITHDGTTYTIVDKAANATGLFVTGKSAFTITHSDGTTESYDVLDAGGTGKASATDSLDIVKQALANGEKVTLTKDATGAAANIEVVSSLDTSSSNREISILDAAITAAKTVTGLQTAAKGIDATYTGLAADDVVTVGGKETTLTTNAPKSIDDIAALTNVLEKGDKIAIIRGAGTTTITIGDKTDEVNDTYTAADALNLIKDGDQVTFTVNTTNTTGTKMALAKGITNGTAYTAVGNGKATDANVITKANALQKISDELATASSIGTDKAATVKNNNDGSFTITKGTVSVKDALAFNLHVGADADTTNKISVDIDSMSTAGLGIKGINVSDDNGTAATYAIDSIADAISKVSSQRSALGAVQNRLEHTIANLNNISENTTSAESAIRDVDMATEMVEYSKNNILAQAGQSMLAQANQSTQGVLSLLQ